MSNIIERRVHDVKRGLITYKGMKNHYVIIGYGEITMSLLDDIFFNRGENMKQEVRSFRQLTRANSSKLAKNIPTVLILSKQDIPTIRAEIYSFLPPSFEKHIIFYSGSIESAEHLQRLNVQYAKEVYILGEQQENGRDTKNLEAVRVISSLRGCSRQAKQSVLPVYVQFDRLTSYSIIQKLALPNEYISPSSSSKIIDANIFFRPFSFYENWARLLWGFTGKPSAYPPLDFERLDNDSDKRVHLVIVGFNRMGRALLFEALRQCHYPNFKETQDDEPCQNKTKITIIDPNLDNLLPHFLCEYPYLGQIKDIEIDYQLGQRGIEHEKIRDTLRRASLDPQCLLTVAVCLQDADLSMSIGLSLPEDLYYNLSDGQIHNSNTRVLIRQELHEGLGRALEYDQARYKNLHIFGMLSQGMHRDLLKDKIPMMVNAYYDIKNAQFERHPIKKLILRKYKDYLKENNFEDCSYKEILSNTQHLAVLEETALKLWLHLSEDTRFSNRYQVDMYGTYLRYANNSALPRMEHLRRNAERSIIGYRQVESKIAPKNADYYINNYIVPFNKLSEERRCTRKDENEREIINNMYKLIKLYTPDMLQMIERDDSDRVSS